MEIKSNIKGKNANDFLTHTSMRRGITLLALVITIIILLILSGITINLVIGENGIIKKAINVGVASEKAEVKETAELIYQDLKIQKYTDGNNKANIDNIIGELIKKGYEIEQVAQDVGIKGIVLDKEIIYIDPNSTDTITVSYKIDQGTKIKYYVLIEGNYYEISLEEGNILISEEATDINAENKLIVKSSNEKSVTIGNIKANVINISTLTTGKATITVQFGNYKKECKIIVGIAPTGNVEILTTGDEEIEVDMQVTAQTTEGRNRINRTNNKRDNIKDNKQ